MNKSLYKSVRRCSDKWKDYPDEYDSSDPQNRQALIEKNLRLAVDIALKYRGRGLSEDELISSAFLGLINAYDKYNEDNTKNLRDRLLASITDTTTVEDFKSIVLENVSYGKVLNALENTDITTTDDMQKFVLKNIPAAKFSTVAWFWIRAQIAADIKRNERHKMEDIDKMKDD